MSERDLSEFLKKPEDEPPFFRCCAVCLLEVVRADYNAHMAAHGYELLEIVKKE